jgi:hypothetical protein
MSKDELVKLLRLEGYMTYADRKEAADLIDQQAARIRELEHRIEEMKERHDQSR